MAFVHLHTHSEYSLLDGANRIGDLVRTARKFEMPALALTDHGCMFGAWDFRQRANRNGIKPILGMEAYVAPGDRRARGRTATEPGVDGAPGIFPDEKYFHLLLLARDAEGYRNLVRLTSIGYVEGFYHRPRVDREVLAQYSGGLIVSSACMAGEVARHLLADRWDAAREAASWYANTFDGRYYLEVQAHDSPNQSRLNERVFRLADELGLPVIATNDAHFLRARDHDAHDVLLCIGLGKDRSDENRMRYDAGLYFKTAQEMSERFPDRPDVIENTLAIADTVDLDIERRYYVPSFPLPADATGEAEYLRQLTFERAHARFGDPLPDGWTERLEYELGVITNPKADYSGYFLIVQDFINWAKSQAIPVGPGRGSAAGSLIAYVLDITEIDPIQFGLLFERFLNPERVSMPDIDVDFCYERRSEVIEYVRERYGRDSVGQIITFGTMKSRAVIRDVGRVLGLEVSETDRLAKLIPNAPNYSLTVAEAAEKIAELKTAIEEDERVARLVEYAKVLEGLSRHASVHAAGVVIAPGPLSEYVPVCTQPTRGAGGGRDDESVLVTQWDMNALEQAGMLKIDLLGLKTLTVVHDAVEWVVRRHGALRHPVTGEEYASARNLPLDDEGVYDMLARGGTAGVFQFESSLATDKLRAMRCDRFEDLIATNALIRPGPLDSGMADVYIRRKLGKESVRYPHPLLEEVLAPTYGVITYQEQVMRMAQVLAGFTLAEADVLRKAVGKKDAKLISAELERFVSRAIESGITQRVAEEIAEQVVTFGRYGFNRSHSVAYALISYQTAWLKRYYPAEFMAAMLSAVVDKTDSVVHYIAECRDLGRWVPERPDGIRVLPPDVNESDWKFTPTGDDAIRFGLGALRGLGASAVGEIIERRGERPFDSLFDFAERVDLRVVGRRAIEALVQGGACDSFAERLTAGAPHRAALFAGLDLVLGEANLRQEEQRTGQVSLFDLGGSASDAPVRPEPKLPTVEHWSEADRLAREKEILGFFISGHPLRRHRDVVRAFGAVTTKNLKQHRDRKVELACVVTQVAKQISKRSGDEWARITVEDFHGTATVLAFGEVWSHYRGTLEHDAAVLIRGSVSGRERDEDAPPIFLDGAEPLSEIRSGGTLALEIELDGDPDPSVIEEARAAFRTHPGGAPLFVRLPSASPGNGHGTEAVRLRSRSISIEPAEPLVETLRRLFGAERIRLVRSGGSAIERSG